MPVPRPTVPVILKPPPIAVKPLPLPMPIAPLATTYQFVATMQSGRPAMQGPLPGGSAWSCDQTRCTMTSSNPNPAVGGCHVIAGFVGPIASYGWGNHMLSPAELDECNRGIPGAVRLAAEAPAAPPAEPAAEPEPSPAPAPASASAPAAPAARFSFVSSELSVVGGPQGTVDPLPGRVAVTGGELSLVGGAQGPRPVIGPPRSIVVPELSVTGR
jgi:hypothetical protein